MLSIPVYNAAGEQIGEETINPADFGGEVNKQLLHEVVLMHLAARRVGTVNTRGRADVAGSGKKLFRQKGTGQRPRRARSGRTSVKGEARHSPAATETIATACPKNRSGRQCAWHSCRSFRIDQAIVVDGLTLSQAKTKEVAKVLSAIRRPDMTEAEAAESVGETKVQARKRTLERRSILFGLPGAQSCSASERP